MYVWAITCNLTQLLYYLGSVLDLRRQPASLHHLIQSNGCSKCISKRKKKDIRLSAAVELIAFIASTCIISTALYDSSLVFAFPIRNRALLYLAHSGKKGEVMYF